MIDWATNAQAARHWADAANLDATRLADLLATASDDGRRFAAASRWRELTDAVTTSGSATLTSALAAFTDDDLGKLVVGAGLPAEARILARASATSVTLTATATATGSAVRVLVLPNRYMLGAIYQARELYNAAVRESADVIGVGDYAIRARPLTAPVKALWRPPAGVPALG